MSSPDAGSPAIERDDAPEPMPAVLIRHGTELDTAYTDALADEALGTLGAAVAGLLLAVRRSRG